MFKWKKLEYGKKPKGGDIVFINLNKDSKDYMKTCTGEIIHCFTYGYVKTNGSSSTDTVQGLTHYTEIENVEV